jgi:hypothetical protein
MPSLALVEVIERLPSLWSGSCGSVVGPCVSLETSSFSRLVTRPLVSPVTYLHVASFLGATTPILVTMDSL